MFLVFDGLDRKKNLKEFEKWEKEAIDTYKYPNRHGTKNYADPVLHPTLPHVAMPILPETLQRVQEDSKTYDRLKAKFGEPIIVESLTDDWFTVVLETVVDEVAETVKLKKKNKP